MTLYKRGRRWWVDVWVRGIRYTKPTGASDRRVAEQIAHKFSEDLLLRMNNIANFQPEMAFAALYDAFVARGCPKPYHIERGRVLLPFFREVAIGQISKNLVRQYRAERHRIRKLTESTVNRDIQALRAILFWAVDEGLLPINPLSRIRLARERRKPMPVLSVADEYELLKVSPPHLREILVAAVDSGMRRGELFDQRWDDVDLDRRVLFVSRSKTPEGEGREVPLSDRLYYILKNRRQNNGLVFTVNGAPVHSIRAVWEAAIRRAGIRYIRFHALRHTFNNRLLEAGILREVRMALMGHSGGDVHSIYVNVESPLRRAAIRRLDEWNEEQFAKTVKKH